ncbi:hypothetical protein Nepgr_006360 [Nepenthes gracilis]|uniref:Uncharacterized protein n=1 Tax=Nepenthes gracilis TaxID=150966 RepID=A0AAD3S5D3_NEPGR|nr:hypothetical protein Nepgr_006360 [Nepenthes gracilis]
MEAKTLLILNLYVSMAVMFIMYGLADSMKDSPADECFSRLSHSCGDSLFNALFNGNSTTKKKGCEQVVAMANRFHLSKTIAMLVDEDYKEQVAEVLDRSMTVWRHRSDVVGDD